jgi:hypothetical protein
MFLQSVFKSLFNLFYQNLASSSIGHEDEILKASGNFLKLAARV